MATDKQIEANRINAQKCTGPKSTEGKAASSQNALKTGLHAKSHVIATENRDDFDILIAEYYNRFQPATPEERCLVDDLVSSEWLGRRYIAAASAIWEYELRDMKEPDLGLAFIRRSEALSRAQRCMTANQRNYAHALKQLEGIQAHRTKRPTQLEPVTETETLSVKLVSFSPIHNEPPAVRVQTATERPKEEQEDAKPPIAA